ncbi:sterol desaturase family protein [Streptomyces sp. NPDC094448]|uniref:sterol desaturase family protein n=1 Tax=Streptomyces sp. NPDC094448 TaxID=3366063 RepID=UPI00380AEDE3
MPNLPDVVLWSIPAFVLLTAVELVSYRLRPDEGAAGYDTRDAVTSVSMGLGSIAFDLLWKIPIVAVYTAVYELTPARVPVLWWTLPLMLLAQDFLYYWSHRGHHVVRILWACHVVHHSSRKFNLTTALRQPWTTWTVWPFYLPMVALGVHPAAVAFCSSVNLVYQFWVHTERIGRLPRPFEYVLNTPSHHRVHHASQGSYLDRNFGGILILWDRLFGSFTAETERPVYGLTKNIDTYNALLVATHEYAAIARDLRAAASWREGANRLLRGPGWQPAPPAAPPPPLPLAASAPETLEPPPVPPEAPAPPAAGPEAVPVPAQPVPVPDSVPGRTAEPVPQTTPPDPHPPAPAPETPAGRAA